MSLLWQGFGPLGRQARTDWPHSHRGRSLGLSGIVLAARAAESYLLLQEGQQSILSCPKGTLALPGSPGDRAEALGTPRTQTSNSGQPLHEGLPPILGDHHDL